jgi:hypothetical protein
MTDYDICINVADDRHSKMQKAGRLRWISCRFNGLCNYINIRQVHIVLTVVLWQIIDILLYT